jgi:hypothetical protein
LPVQAITLVFAENISRRWPKFLCYYLAISAIVADHPKLFYFSGLPAVSGNTRSDFYLDGKYLF